MVSNKRRNAFSVLEVRNFDENQPIYCFDIFQNRNYFFIFIFVIILIVEFC